MGGVMSMRFGTHNPPQTGHAWWRIFISDNQGDATGIVLAEVEMRATVGGADQCSGGTAIGSDDATSNEFVKAFDNSASTEWFANSGPTNQWIGYHFASSVDVQEVAITFSNSSTSTELNRCPKTCSVDYSDDGSSWTTAFSFVVYGHLIGATRVYPESAPAAGYHRFWRMFSVTTGSTRTEMAEMEFRATSGGADQTVVLSTDVGDATGRTVSSAVVVSNEPYKAFDNNNANTWFELSGTNQYCGFIFPSPVKVEEVQLVGPSTASRAPTSLKFEYSDDGVSWTTQKSHTSLSWSSSETKVLAAI